MAIIIKMIEDKPVYNKIDPTLEEKEKALKLHKCLETLIPKMEKKFEKEVCDKKKTRRRKSRINNKLVYKLGEEIKQAICDVSEDEIDWVFIAIREIYSKRNVFLQRGKRRDDFRYIFEAAKLPYEFFNKITWDGWRRLMDSPNVRSEKRFMTWLERKYDETKEIKRGFVRKFLKRLNALLENKDTSVFADSELFEIYEKAWKLAISNQDNKKRANK